MAKLQNRRKKSAALVVAAGLTVAGTGVAYAYWTSTGEGDGTATTGTSIPFVVAAQTATGGPLTPGGATQLIPFTVTNPANAGVQTLSAVTASVLNADGSAFASGDCSADDYTVTITTPPAYGAIQPGGVVDGSATVTMLNLDSNQDDCQGVTVPIKFVADAPQVP